MISSRELAYTILFNAIKHRSYINLQLKGVSHPDMPFVNALVYGVMQNYRQCRHFYEPFITKKVSTEVDIILLLSAYQNHFMRDIPQYAIKSEAMKLCEKYASYGKGFVNAMVEKIFSAQPVKAKDEFDTEGVSLETSFEPWIIRMWQAHYGHDFAYQYAKFSNTPSPIFGFLHYQNNNDISTYGTKLNDYTFLADKTLINHNDFQTKQVFIADIHAQVVGFNTPIQPKERVLDACGAPGGKSMMMAMKVKDDAEIICADISLHRLELVKQSVSKTKLKSIQTYELDARMAHTQFELSSFDGILVDAPCSGLGVLRRKPEIKMFITPEDIDGLVKIQAEILASCAKILKLGGWMVYSTCTLNKKENESQIKTFLKTHPEFICEHIMPFDSFKTEGDGFFMATLRKIQ
jgi:16S rRNA (cytosine967-C5)-methyltransferase